MEYEWHKYRFRVRDILLFLILLQFLLHLFVQWDRYQCEMFGNVQLLFFLLSVLARQLTSHYKFKIYLFFTLVCSGLSILMVYTAAENVCLERSGFYTASGFGFLLTLRTIQRTFYPIRDEVKRKISNTDL
ncbi:hypothetical protein pb186bvf_018364 [Paramecium bursaria]